MRFLLPHERWLVPRVLRSQKKRRTAAVVAMEKRYGPDGMIWLDASLADALLCAALSIVGFIIVFAHPTRTSVIGGYCLLAAALSLVLDFVRLIQARRAGRRFRADSGQ
jgi:hypothetical protein